MPSNSATYFVTGQSKPTIRTSTKLHGQAVKSEMSLIAGEEGNPIEIDAAENTVFKVPSSLSTKTRHSGQVKAKSKHVSNFPRIQTAFQTAFDGKTAGEVSTGAGKSLQPDVKTELFYCLTCSYCYCHLQTLKFHTIVEHPVSAAVVSYKPIRDSSISQSVIFFCVKESCDFYSVICSAYERHLISCCSHNDALLVVEMARLESTITYISEYQIKHNLTVEQGFLQFVLHWLSTKKAISSTLPCQMRIASTHETSTESPSSCGAEASHVPDLSGQQAGTSESLVSPPAAPVSLVSTATVSKSLVNSATVTQPASRTMESQTFQLASYSCSDLPHQDSLSFPTSSCASALPLPKNVKCVSSQILPSSSSESLILPFSQMDSLDQSCQRRVDGLSSTEPYRDNPLLTLNSQPSLESSAELILDESWVRFDVTTSEAQNDQQSPIQNISKQSSSQTSTQYSPQRCSPLSSTRMVLQQCTAQSPGHIVPQQLIIESSGHIVPQKLAVQSLGHILPQQLKNQTSGHTVPQQLTIQSGGHIRLQQCSLTPIIPQQLKQGVRQTSSKSCMAHGSNHSLPWPQNLQQTDMPTILVASPQEIGMTSFIDGSFQLQDNSVYSIPKGFSGYSHGAPKSAEKQHIYSVTQTETNKGTHLGTNSGALRYLQNHQCVASGCGTSAQQKTILNDSSFLFSRSLSESYHPSRADRLLNCDQLSHNRTANMHSSSPVHISPQFISLPASSEIVPPSFIADGRANYILSNSVYKVPSKETFQAATEHTGEQNRTHEIYLPEVELCNGVPLLPANCQDTGLEAQHFAMPTSNNGRVHRHHFVLSVPTSESFSIYQRQQTCPRDSECLVLTSVVNPVIAEQRPGIISRANVVSPVIEEQRPGIISRADVGMPEDTFSNDNSRFSDGLSNGTLVLSTPVDQELRKSQNFVSTNQNMDMGQCSGVDSAELAAALSNVSATESNYHDEYIRLSHSDTQFLAPVSPNIGTDQYEIFKTANLSAFSKHHQSSLINSTPITTAIVDQNRKRTIPVFDLVQTQAQNYPVQTPRRDPPSSSSGAREHLRRTEVSTSNKSSQNTVANLQPGLTLSLDHQDSSVSSSNMDICTNQRPFPPCKTLGWPAGTSPLLLIPNHNKIPVWPIQAINCSLYVNSGSSIITENQTPVNVSLSDSKSLSQHKIPELRPSLHSDRSDSGSHSQDWRFVNLHQHQPTSSSSEPPGEPKCQSSQLQPMQQDLSHIPNFLHAVTDTQALVKEHSLNTESNKPTSSESLDDDDIQIISVTQNSMSQSTSTSSKTIRKRKHESLPGRLMPIGSNQTPEPDLPSKRRQSVPVKSDFLQSDQNHGLVEAALLPQKNLTVSNFTSVTPQVEEEKTMEAIQSTVSLVENQCKFMKRSCHTVDPSMKQKASSPTVVVIEDDDDDVVEVTKSMSLKFRTPLASNRIDSFRTPWKSDASSHVAAEKSISDTESGKHVVEKAPTKQTEIPEEGGLSASQKNVTNSDPQEVAAGRDPDLTHTGVNQDRDSVNLTVEPNQDLVNNSKVVDRKSASSNTCLISHSTLCFQSSPRFISLSDQKYISESIGSVVSMIRGIQTEAIMKSGDSLTAPDESLEVKSLEYMPAKGQGQTPGDGNKVSTQDVSSLCSLVCMSNFKTTLKQVNLERINHPNNEQNHSTIGYYSGQYDQKDRKTNSLSGESKISETLLSFAGRPEKINLDFFPIRSELQFCGKEMASRNVFSHFQVCDFVGPKMPGKAEGQASPLTLGKPRTETTQLVSYVVIDGDEDPPQAESNIGTDTSRSAVPGNAVNIGACPTEQVLSNQALISEATGNEFTNKNTESASKNSRTETFRDSNDYENQNLIVGDTVVLTVNDSQDLITVDSYDLIAKNTGCDLNMENNKDLMVEESLDLNEEESQCARSIESQCAYSIDSQNSLAEESVKISAEETQNLNDIQYDSSKEDSPDFSIDNCQVWCIENGQEEIVETLQELTVETSQGLSLENTNSNPENLQSFVVQSSQALCGELGQDWSLKHGRVWIVEHDQVGRVRNSPTDRLVADNPISHLKINDDQRLTDSTDFSIVADTIPGANQTTDKGAKTSQKMKPKFRAHQKINSTKTDVNIEVDKNSGDQRSDQNSILGADGVGLGSSVRYQSKCAKKQHRPTLSGFTTGLEFDRGGLYQCWMCPKVFSKCRSVKYHMVTKHTGGLCAIDLNNTQKRKSLYLLLFCPKTCLYHTDSREDMRAHLSRCKKKMLKSQPRQSYLQIMTQFLDVKYDELQKRNIKDVLRVSNLDAKRKRKSATKGSSALIVKLPHLNKSVSFATGSD